ncbi:MAG: hypothetical protein M4D80_38740 [Myxococcota bacterium]|nr:hypothetical protein [Myxococcota bacterium]
MRNLIMTLAVLAACGGPSGKDVAMAKQARYQGDKLELFANMKQTVESKYKLDVSDETQLAVKTTARWYTPEGLVSNWTPSDVGTQGHKLPDRSLNITLVAQVLPSEGNWVVHIEPVILRFNANQPKLEPVRLDDPSLPGFVKGKSDELAFDVNKKLKQWEVKSPGGNIAPPPADPALPPPGTAPAPEAGSAAPQ